MVQDFSQLRVLPPSTNKQNNNKNRRSLVVDFDKEEEQSKEEGTIRMDALVQDLNFALEESTRSVAGPNAKERCNYERTQSFISGKQRRAWRRRCKSTSNLAAITQETKADSLPSTKKGNNDVKATAYTFNMMATTKTNSDETGNYYKGTS